MRKSLEDVKHMIRNKPYPNALPDKLAPFHAYVSDSGHCLMCIPAKFEGTAFGASDPWGYEIPLPVKYVLETGYRQRGDYLIVEVPYDDTLGATVDSKYDEF